jgi:hypothetical protein
VCKIYNNITGCLNTILSIYLSHRFAFVLVVCIVLVVCMVLVVCICFSCLYLLWLFVFTVFVVCVCCICSVCLLLNVFILSVVLL